MKKDKKEIRNKEEISDMTSNPFATPADDSSLENSASNGYSPITKGIIYGAFIGVGMAAGGFSYDHIKGFPQFGYLSMILITGFSVGSFAVLGGMIGAEQYWSRKNE